MEVSQFTCSICGDPSRDICIQCTKDTCANHFCERCRRCSDCCECDVPMLSAEVKHSEVDTVVANESAESTPVPPTPESPSGTLRDRSDTAATSV